MEELISFLSVGPRISIEDFSNIVGMGSASHVLHGADFTILTMSWSDNSRKFVKDRVVGLLIS